MGLTRSQQMARIRGTETGPETHLRRALRAGVIGERIGRIRPDLVIRRRSLRVAVFVDGCFWHGCPQHYVRPRSGTEFWSNKLRENTSRDTRQTQLLLDEGWLVVRLWEHEVIENVEKAAGKVRAALASGRSRVERWRVVEVTALADDHEQRELRKLLKPHHWRKEAGPRTTAKVGRVIRKLIGEGR
jgi:DNA mismatch endonuclease (patch repair protein)